MKTCFECRWAVYEEWGKGRKVMVECDNPEFPESLNTRWADFDDFPAELAQICGLSEEK